ncbi:MAG: hypothetical protein CMJ20_03000 [Phycisphaeraceae bacterium]|nr:hypothetical protein [Phycisphaeraceae bacterium]
MGYSMKTTKLESAKTRSHPPFSRNSEAVVIDKVSPEHRNQALSFIFTGNSSNPESTIDPFVAFSEGTLICLDELWSATKSTEMLAAALIVPSPGRSAMVFISPGDDQTHVKIYTSLIQRACESLNPQNVCLAQALIEPGQNVESGGLQGAGFEEIAELIYMQRAVYAKEVALELNNTFTISTWLERHKQRFAQAILASYHDTLDCPGLVGLRQINDIIAGHMATGMFDPNLWFTVYHGHDPVAVMLLNLVPQNRTIELVYLGVSPAWRGQRIGRKLLHHGLGMASKYAATHMVLAVDRANGPALRLYRSFRFKSSSVKKALVHVVPQS